MPGVPNLFPNRTYARPGAWHLVHRNVVTGLYLFNSQPRAVYALFRLVPTILTVPIQYPPHSFPDSLRFTMRVRPRSSGSPLAGHPTSTEPANSHVAAGRGRTTRFHPARPRRLDRSTTLLRCLSVIQLSALRRHTTHANRPQISRASLV